MAHRPAAPSARAVVPPEVRPVGAASGAGDDARAETGASDGTDRGVGTR